MFCFRFTVLVGVSVCMVSCINVSFPLINFVYPTSFWREAGGGWVKRREGASAGPRGHRSGGRFVRSSLRIFFHLRTPVRNVVGDANRVCLQSVSHASSKWESQQHQQTYLDPSCLHEILFWRAQPWNKMRPRKNHSGNGNILDLLWNMLQRGSRAIKN